MEWVFFLIGVLMAVPASVLAVRRRRAGKSPAAAGAGHARNAEDIELVKSIGGLTHEINNPLSTIKLNLKLLSEDFADSDDDRARRNFNRLERLQDEVQRLQEFVKDFRNYVGDRELNPTDMDLRRIIEELTDFFRPQAQSRHVVLRSAMPQTPAICRVDVGLIKQALLNLIINATQVMSGGGELLLRLSSDSGQAVIEVIDTGPGIELRLREKVFDAYYSTRPGGSGLGLPTTRRIIRRHGGDIHVDGEPGKGTRFVVTLPLAKAE